MLLGSQPGSAQDLSRPGVANSSPTEQPPVMNGTGGPSNPGGVYATSNLSGMCAGDHATFTAGGGDGTYTWSPATGLSATTGAVVVASPGKGNPTYTVTSHNPTTGAVTTATLSLTVRENCCPTTYRSGLVEITGSLFTSATGSPFAGYPAGTRFHLAGASPVVLRDLAYAPPMGSVILMDGGQDLVLENGASLNLTGVSITAACHDMWGKLLVRGNAGGITAQPFTPPSLSSTLYNQISHSLGGVEFEEATGSQAPFYRFAATDFRHNEQSLKLSRAGVAGNASDQVSNCSFDSTPEYFKAPLAYAVGTSNYPHYSRYHMWFVGNVGQNFRNNRFLNAMFGIYSPNVPNTPVMSVYMSAFENLYLAGISVNASGTGGNITVGNGCVFTFPSSAADASIQNRAQVVDVRTSDVLDQLPETRGVFANNASLRLQAAYFTQPDGSVYPDFDFTQRDKQVGVKARRLQAMNGCSFTLLHTGVEFSEVWNGLTINSITDNVFSACRIGIAVSGGGINRSSSPDCLCPPSTVSLPLTCNTFDRLDDVRSGIAYGIALNPGNAVKFGPLTNSSSPPVLKNKFLDYGIGKSGFYAIVNGNCCTTQYTSYDNYINTNGVLPGHTRLGLLCSTIALSYSPSNNYISGQACGVGSPGLERVAVKSGSLGSISPNPVVEQVTIAYQLPLQTQTAELRIQRGNDGRLLERHSLRLEKAAHTLNTLGWPSGVYFVGLYANDLLVQTQRLLVQ